MKIAYLLTQSLESPSGLGRYWPLARELAKRGHNVSIYALHPDIDSLEERQYRSEGVTIHYVAPMHVRKSGTIKSYYNLPALLGITLLATWNLSRQAISTEAEILHIGKPHPMNSLAGLAGKWFKGKKLFLDCDDYEAASGNFSSEWQRSAIALFEKKIPFRVETITTNTHFMRNKLKSWGVPSERIVYLPNGVDRDRFRKPAEEKINRLRNELNLQDKQVIGYIGSMSLASHAVDLLLEAFRIVRISKPNTTLLLVGGGEDFQKIRNLANSMQLENDIRFVGRIPPEQVSLYYHLLDLSVDPVYDNDAARGRSPLKLFESWACGVPFVTSDVGDRRQLIGEPPAGILALPGNPDSLARSIFELLDNPELQQEVINQGFERVETYYWDKLTDRISTRYKKIVGDTNSL